MSDLADLRGRTSDPHNDGKPYTSKRVAEIVGLKAYGQALHFTTVLKWEARGVTDIRVLRALAELYARSLDEIETAARLSREKNMTK